MKKTLLLIVFIILYVSTGIVRGQYFGQNKVNYDKFPFKVYATDHFRIYNYLKDTAELNDFAELCERWYLRHQAVFLDTIRKKIPIILYNDHADFQQTTVIQSILGPGTGGVTEGLRDRVVMPLMESNAETNHVIGHEMVHVFQYNLLERDRNAGIQSAANIPTWLIEGMAEYMSQGKSDALTSMWMRDAVISHQIPTIKEMTTQPNKYFPYRYGQALWAYIASKYGDAIIRPFFMSSATKGYKYAIDSVLHVSPDSLSNMWKADLIKAYTPQSADTTSPVGTKVLDAKDVGRMNIAPSISPDGRYMIFLSDKDVISTDFYLVNIKKRKIVRKLTRVKRNSHIDEYSYLESTGSWSPDGKYFALTSYIGGKKQLIVMNINKLKPEKIYKFPQLDFFNNPAWSPNGNQLVVTGLKEGQSDLYLLNLDTKKVTQLTNDRYSDLEPSWSPDGKKIVFMSDRSPQTNFEKVKYGKYRICIYNVDSNSVKTYNFFPGVNNSNPHFSSDGRKIYFVSSANGAPNLYEYDMNDSGLFRLSNFYTGISGITNISPALSVARDTSLMLYIYYRHGGYHIYKARPSEFTKTAVYPDEINLRPTILPPLQASGPRRVVDRNMDAYPLKPRSDFKSEPYKPKFKLENVGSPGLGVGVAQNTTFLAGGVSFLFSDILNRNMMLAAASIQGRIYDFGGELAYINQYSRFNWGASLSHIPYLYTYSFLEPDTIQGTPLADLVYMQQRIFEDQLNLFAHYPVSQKLRFEGGVTASRYSFRLDSINNYFYNGYEVNRNRKRLEAPKPFYTYSAYVAYVGDNSHFGYTSPLSGYRFRFQVGKSFGRFNYWNVLADYRKYFFIKPLGIAFRIMHNGRYGGNSNELYPQFIGYPYYIRGYTYNSFYSNRCASGNCLTLNQLTGSKIGVVNMELRFPFTGIKRLSLFKLKFLYSDFVLFADGGLAWNNFSNIDFKWKPAGENRHVPVFSAGASLRINLFGAVIVEPYYAIPFQRDNIKFGVPGIFLSAGGW